MTANFNAKGAIKIQKEIGSGFLNLSEKKLAEKLKLLGHRFPNKRAEFIVRAREKRPELNRIIRDNKRGGINSSELREWLVKNIKGIGYKEASHFLRNIGFKNLAIIDFHIIDILVKNRIIKRPKSMSRRTYIEIENVLREIARRAKLNLAELDLYLWYMETNKILK